MTATKTKTQTHVIAMYPDHAAAEDAVRRLQAGGIPMQDVSIIGKDFQAVEKPVGFVTAGSLAKDGARIGAWSGGIFGLLVGAGVLILPGIGPVIIAGPLAAAMLGIIEGTLTGAAVGGIAGALVGLGLPKDKAIRYESEVKTGKLLVTVRGDATQIERARTILAASKAESAEVTSPDSAAA
jgi:hypothetical protein